MSDFWDFQLPSFVNSVLTGEEFVYDKVFSWERQVLDVIHLTIIFVSLGLYGFSNISSSPYLTPFFIARARETNLYSDA
jgi:hypothetical protein